MCTCIVRNIMVLFAKRQPDPAQPSMAKAIIHVYICICIYTCIYIYTCVYIYTYIHTYIHVGAG